MNNINRAAAAGVIFFMVILAGFVGVKVDQTTIALLGGAFIGLVVAIPTTALIMIVGLSGTRLDRRDEPKAPPPAAPQFWNAQPTTTNNYYDQRRVVVVVNVPQGADATTARLAVANALRVVPSEAQRMIDAGEVKCLPAGR